MSHETLVLLDNVTFEYPDSANGTLGSVSFSLAGRECVSVVGPSGVGKTTLLRLISGVLRPSSGRIEVAGPVAVVGQREPPLPNLTPRRQIELVVRRKESIWERTLPSRKAAELVTGYLEMVQLNDQADQIPSQLSGGQLQRLAFAQALAQGAKVLLLDEPFGALDFVSRERMQRQLASLIEMSGLAVILITHDMSEAVFCGNKIVVLAPSTIGAQSIEFENLRSDSDFQNKYGAAFLKSCALVQSAFQAFEEDGPQFTQLLDMGFVKEIDLMKIESRASHVFVVTKNLFQDRKNPIIRDTVRKLQEGGLPYTYFVPQITSDINTFRDEIESHNVAVTCVSNPQLEQWYLFGETVLYKMPNGKLMGYSYLGDIGATSLFRLPDPSVDALSKALGKKV